MEATSFLKHIWTMLKKKSDTIKEKADGIMNTQMLLIKSVKNDNILGSVSNKIKFNWRNRFSAKFKGGEKKEDPNNPPSMELLCASPDRQELESLSQKLFGGSDASGSPRNTPEIRSENEIDKIAGSFIRRFHNQMKLQKQDSYNAMLARSV